METSLMLQLRGHTGTGRDEKAWGAGAAFDVWLLTHRPDLVNHRLKDMLDAFYRLAPDAHIDSIEMHPDPPLKNP